MDNSNQLKSLEDTILRAQNELAQAQAKLEELKKENKSGWKPYKQGFYIDGNGNIDILERSSRPNVHNCFRSIQMAELRQKQREAEDELFNIWDILVGDWRPDWKDDKQKKYTFSIFRGNRNIDDLRVINKPMYRFFPTHDLALRQYAIASDHAKAYMRGEF